jgi:hypothetical protein
MTFEDRVLNRFDSQDERLLELLKDIHTIKTDLEVLKAQRDGTAGGIKLVGWVLVFGVNIASVIVTYFIAK